ncbi:hypothetical protein PSFL107428_03235 [Pseudoalteromonas maricaloris]
MIFPFTGNFKVLMRQPFFYKNPNGLVIFLTANYKACSLPFCDEVLMCEKHNQ